MSRDEKRGRPRPARGRGTPKVSGGKTARRSTSTRDYEKRVDLRAALTPKNDDLLPPKKSRPARFEKLKERLKDKEKFAGIDEKDAQELTIELNRWMLDEKHTPAPADVLREILEIADLTSRRAAALERARGATISVMTGVEELFPPYLSLPRGVPVKVRSKASRAASEKLLQTAFPELASADAISEREEQFGLCAARVTTDQRQIVFLDAYDRAKQARSDRERGELYVPWPGPPIRETCIVPTVERDRALVELARKNAREFGVGHARRGKLASLAREAWERGYAKRCWTFIRAKFGDATAVKMTAAENGDFVALIRAIAEYASGQKIESGFGGAAKIAVKWGRDEVKREQRIEEIHRTGNAHSIAVTKAPFES
jgi:hypothetical protein